MNEEQVRKIVRDELYFMLKNDKFVFQLPIQIIDGKNIQTGKSVGTMIGTESTQKIGFFGETPVAQQFVADAATGGTTVDAEARYLVNYIRSNLISLGLFYPS